MKKIIFSLSALAALLLAGSCQRENLEPVEQGGTVTYTVQVPGALATKAAGDYELIYEVYRETQVGTGAPIYEGKTTFSGNSVDLPLEFVKDQNFVVLFWAQKVGLTAYNTGNLRNVTISAEHEFTANNDDYEVFAGNDKVIKCQSQKNGKVSLVRPVAQINIATTKAGLILSPVGSEQPKLVEVANSDVEVYGLWSSFNVAIDNVLDETVAGNTNVEFTVATSPAKSPNSVEYDSEHLLVAKSYVGFIPKNGATVKVDFNLVTSDDGTIHHEVSNVPVKPNYKTNIIGNLISATADYNVTLGAWATEETNVEIWDGKTISTPDFDATTQTWTIDNGAELAWVAAFVNKTLPATKSTVPEYDGTQNFVLGKNINLGDNEFTPIGVGGKRFSSTFDGNGHIISNFKITKYTGDQAALFGNLAGTVKIKNLTIQKANIVYPGQGDFYASGLVATAYGNVTIENVIVEKSYISGNNKVAGLLAHDGVVSALTIKNCHVRDCKIESLNEADGGNVGGLVGLLQAGIQHNISNSSVKNTVINAINSTNTGKRSNGEFVACLSGKDNQILVITDCVVEDNTFSQIYNGTDPVTYVSPYGVFVGGNRNDDGKGTVIVNGCVAVDGYPNLYKHVESGEYMIYDLAGLKDFHAYLKANTGRHPYDRVYNIMNDIDAAGWTWNSINVIKDAGDAKGLVLDGKEHTISNLKIDGEGMLTSASAGSVIKNITMDKATVTSTGHNAAIFWGSVYSSVSFENVHVKGSTINGRCNAGAFVGGTYEPNNLIVTFKNCSVKASEIKAVGYNGQDPTGASGFLGKAYGSTKVKFSETNEIDATTITNENGLVGGKVYGYTIYVDNGWDGTGACDAFADFDGVKPVAKVNNAEYYTIDKAIAAWTHNSTLTLLSDVKLTDVVTLKSTEYHILNLGTYTMTAANGKDAISISNEGRSSASYALDINADATNPGGITATGKAVVKTTGKSGVKDRPIIRFYNGVFTGTNVVYHSGSNGTNCPQFWFYGGVFNGTVNANRALFQFHGGTFNGNLHISVDSSAYALISGGRFINLNNSYRSDLDKDNNIKITIGSAKGVYDRGIYVDDQGYFVVGGSSITDFGEQFQAKVNIKPSSKYDYLFYSSAAEHGLYYTDAAVAIAKHGEANVVLPTPAPKSNEIWYVSDEMALEPTNSDAINATIVSNVWDKTTGKGVITFDVPLTTIGEKAFQSVTNTTPSNWITSISLPKGLETIGNFAFAQCNSLTTITIPDTVTAIGQYAFQGCGAVTSVTIGRGVTGIGNGAFYNCYEIKEIVCKSTEPPTLADKWVFNGVDKAAKVIVPASSVDKYKADAFWSSFTNIVAE